VAQEPASKQEISELRSLVARNLSDAAAAGLSEDGRYDFAYNAFRTLAVMVVRASGYRVKAMAGSHKCTFEALETADVMFARQAGIGDAARAKRNHSSYDAIGLVSDAEANDLINEANEFRKKVEAWLAANYPSLA
jgi:hypothetical protein